MIFVITIEDLKTPGAPDIGMYALEAPNRESVEVAAAIESAKDRVAQLNVNAFMDGEKADRYTWRIQVLELNTWSTVGYYFKSEIVKREAR